MAEGEGGCLTLGFKPAFSPSAALIWLHFLMLKMLTPSFFPSCKDHPRWGALLPKGSVSKCLCGDFFYLNCMSSMFDLVVVSEHLTLIEDKDMKNCVFP